MKESVKQSEQSKNTNLFNNLKKLGKKFENYEKYFNYAHKNHGISLNVNEFDFKDKEIKMLNFDEPSDRKEILHFIENLNDYSCRKLAPNAYVNKRLMEVKGKKFAATAATNANGHSLQEKPNTKANNSNEDKMQIDKIPNGNEIAKNQNDKNEKNIIELNSSNNNFVNNNNVNNNNNCNYANSETINDIAGIHADGGNNHHHEHHGHHHKRSHFFSNKLSEMKHNYLLEKAHHNKDASHNSQDSLEIFNKLSEATAKAPKASNTDKIRMEDYNLIVEIFNKHEIIKDIFLINNYIKYSNYSEMLKKQKRNLVKNFTNEIETYRQNMKNNRNLSNPVKANLELLNSFLNKIKPNNPSTAAV